MSVQYHHFSFTHHSYLLLFMDFYVICLYKTKSAIIWKEKYEILTDTVNHWNSLNLHIAISDSGALTVYTTWICGSHSYEQCMLTFYYYNWYFEMGSKYKKMHRKKHTTQTWTEGSSKRTAIGASTVSAFINKIYTGGLYLEMIVWWITFLKMVTYMASNLQYHATAYW